MGERLLNDVWCTFVELVEQAGDGCKVERRGTCWEWRFGEWSLLVNWGKAAEYARPAGERGPLKDAVLVPAGCLAVWLRGVCMGCVGPFDRVKGGRWSAVVGGLCDEVGVVQGITTDGEIHDSDV